MPFSGQERTGDSQSPVTPKAKRQTTAAKIKGAVGSGKSKHQTKSQNQPAPKTLNVSMPAIKGKMEKKLQKQATQESSEENTDESLLELKIDPQAQPLPADPSDDEILTGSVDRPSQTKSIPTDTQRYRDDVDSEDDVQITGISPRKASKPTGSSHPYQL